MLDALYLEEFNERIPMNTSLEASQNFTVNIRMNFLNIHSGTYDGVVEIFLNVIHSYAPFTRSGIVLLHFSR